MIPLLLYELLVFGAIQGFGLLVASRLMRLEQFTTQVIQFTATDFIAIFLIATAFFFIFRTFLRGATLFKFLFIFLILVGSKAALSAFFSNILASVLTLVVLVIWLVFPYVLTHNFVMLMAISGIGASIGIGVTPATVISILAVLSLYDVIAVYKTKHMVTMFNKLLEKGVVMAIVMPKSAMATTASVKEIKPGPKHGFMLLGTGDIAFPLIFAVSVMKTSLFSALFVVAGALVGVVVVNKLLIGQAERRAIPALPPIALCSILGFFLSLIV